MNATEIAVVPDFTGEMAAVFEARTLFFLASWLECPSSGNTGLQLACVGEPPDSVRRLAARAGGRIGVHQPVPGFWGGYANKLRGLDDMEPGARRWLLDADVLVVGALDALRGIEADFAAAVAGKPQVPQPVWEHIYTSLGLPVPLERIPSLRGKLGLSMDEVSYRYDGQQQEAGAMLPYYNSGVLLARGDGGLRERWEDHMRRILELASGSPEMASLHAVMFGDQVGLATALQSLRAQGCTFATLPDACNVRLPHLSAGVLRWRDIGLFHATGFLRELSARADLPVAVDSYAARWEEAIREGGGTVEDCGQPRRFLRGLWERWVRPEWERRG